uniref:DNA-binding protein n=1 Tax=Thermorudis peleae TaxID=1382356 RepID=A0A831X6V0_9BACT
MAEPMLTVREVAERLRVNAETVRRWLRSGQLKGVWLSDRAGWRIPAGELERFLRERSGHQMGLSSPDLGA